MATDVARSVVCVCVFLCVGNTNVLRKTRLNRRRCRFVGPKNQLSDGRSGAISAVVQQTGKQWESAAVYAANGIVHSSITACQCDCRSSVSHYIVPVKNRPLRCGLASKFFDHSLFFDEDALKYCSCPKMFTVSIPVRSSRKCPGVGTQTLVPLNFSAVVAPLPQATFVEHATLGDPLSSAEKFNHCMNGGLL